MTNHHYERDIEFMNATKAQLERWQRNFFPGTAEREAITHELLYRKYADLYGHDNAYDMLDRLVRAEAAYNERLAVANDERMEQLEMEWDAEVPG